MTSPIQPPALPQMVDWVWYAVAGQSWPETNEALLYRLAEQWETLATALNEGAPNLSGGVAELTAWYGGTTGQELAFTSYDVLRGLQQLNQAAIGRHLMVRMGAMDVELTKYTMIVEALVTAIAVLYATLSSYLTFGTSTASIPALVGSGRTAIGRLAAELVRRLGSRGAGEAFRRLSRQGARHMLIEGVQEIGEEVTIVAGAGLLSGQGLDWGRMARAGGAGFVGGAAGVGIFGRDFFGFGNRFMRDQMRAGGFRPVATRMLQSALQNPPTSALGGWVASGFDGGLPGLGGMFVDGFFGAALVGGTRAGLTLSGGMLGTRLNPVQVDPRTGLASLRHGGEALIPSQLPASRLPAVQHILGQANLPEGAATVPSSNVFRPHPGGASNGATAAPASPAELLTPGTNDQARAWLPDIEQQVRQQLDGLPLAGQGRLRVEFVVPAEGGTLVGMAVTDQAGTPIGSMTRMFSRDADGTAYVEHVNTVLIGESGNPQAPTGEFDPRVEQAYRQLGFEEVRLLPGVTDPAAAAAANADFPPDAGPGLPRQVLEAAVEFGRADRGQALAEVMRGLGTEPAQASAATTELALISLDQQVAGAEQLLARMDQPGSPPPAAYEISQLGEVGAAGLRSAEWSGVKQLASDPGPPPAAATTPADVESPAMTRWLARPDVHSVFAGHPAELRVTGPVSEPVGPLEALAAMRVFGNDPRIEYVVGADGQVLGRPALPVVIGGALAAELTAAQLAQDLRGWAAYQDAGVRRTVAARLGPTGSTPAPDELAALAAELGPRSAPVADAVNLLRAAVEAERSADGQAAEAGRRATEAVQRYRESLLGAFLLPGEPAPVDEQPRPEVGAGSVTVEGYDRSSPPEQADGGEVLVGVGAPATPQAVVSAADAAGSVTPDGAGPTSPAGGDQQLEAGTGDSGGGGGPADRHRTSPGTPDDGDPWQLVAAAQLWTIVDTMAAAIRASEDPAAEAAAARLAAEAAVAASAPSAPAAAELLRSALDAARAVADAEIARRRGEPAAAELTAAADGRVERLRAAAAAALEDSIASRLGGAGLTDSLRGRYEALTDPRARAQVAILHSRTGGEPRWLTRTLNRIGRAAEARGETLEDGLVRRWQAELALRDRYEALRHPDARAQLARMLDRMGGNAESVAGALDRMEQTARAAGRTLESALVDQWLAESGEPARNSPPPEVVAEIDALLAAITDIRAKVLRYQADDPGVEGTQRWLARLDHQERSLTGKRLDWDDPSVDRLGGHRENISGIEAELDLAERSAGVVEVSKDVSVAGAAGETVATDVDVVADGGRVWREAKNLGGFGVESNSYRRLENQLRQQLQIIALGERYHVDGAPPILEWNFTRAVDAEVAAALESVRIVDPGTGEELPHRVTVMRKVDRRLLDPAHTGYPAFRSDTREPPDAGDGARVPPSEPDPDSPPGGRSLDARPTASAAGKGGGGRRGPDAPAPTDPGDDGPEPAGPRGETAGLGPPAPNPVAAQARGLDDVLRAEPGEVAAWTADLLDALRRTTPAMSPDLAGALTELVTAQAELARLREEVLAPLGRAGAELAPDTVDIHLGLLRPGDHPVMAGLRTILGQAAVDRLSRALEALPAAQARRDDADGQLRSAIDRMSRRAGSPAFDEQHQRLSAAERAELVRALVRARIDAHEAANRIADGDRVAQRIEAARAGTAPAPAGGWAERLDRAERAALELERRLGTGGPGVGTGSPAPPTAPAEPDPDHDGAPRHPSGPPEPPELSGPGDVSMDERWPGADDGGEWAEHLTELVTSFSRATLPRQSSAGSAKSMAMLAANVDALGDMTVDEMADLVAAAGAEKVALYRRLPRIFADTLLLLDTYVKLRNNVVAILVGSGILRPLDALRLATMATSVGPDATATAQARDGRSPQTVTAGDLWTDPTYQAIRSVETAHGLFQKLSTYQQSLTRLAGMVPPGRERAVVMFARDLAAWVADETAATTHRHLFRAELTLGMFGHREATGLDGQFVALAQAGVLDGARLLDRSPADGVDGAGSSPDGAQAVFDASSRGRAVTRDASRLIDAGPRSLAEPSGYERYLSWLAEKGPLLEVGGGLDLESWEAGPRPGFELARLGSHTPHLIAIHARLLADEAMRPVEHQAKLEALLVRLESSAPELTSEVLLALEKRTTARAQLAYFRARARADLNGLGADLDSEATHRIIDEMATQDGLRDVDDDGVALGDMLSRAGISNHRAAIGALESLAVGKRRADTAEREWLDVIAAYSGLTRPIATDLVHGLAELPEIDARDRSRVAAALLAERTATLLMHRFDVYEEATVLAVRLGPDAERVASTIVTATREWLATVDVSLIRTQQDLLGAMPPLVEVVDLDEVSQPGVAETATRLYEAELSALFWEAQIGDASPDGLPHQLPRVDWLPATSGGAAGDVALAADDLLSIARLLAREPMAADEGLPIGWPRSDTPAVPLAGGRSVPEIAARLRYLVGEVRGIVEGTYWIGGGTGVPAVTPAGSSPAAAAARLLDGLRYDLHALLADTAGLGGRLIELIDGDYRRAVAAVLERRGIQEALLSRTVRAGVPEPEAVDLMLGTDRVDQLGSLRERLGGIDPDRSLVEPLYDAILEEAAALAALEIRVRPDGPPVLPLLSALVRLLRDSLRVQGVSEHVLVLGPPGEAGDQAPVAWRIADAKAALSNDSEAALAEDVEALRPAIRQAVSVEAEISALLAAIGRDDDGAGGTPATSPGSPGRGPAGVHADAPREPADPAVPAPDQRQHGGEALGKPGRGEPGEPPESSGRRRSRLPIDLGDDVDHDRPFVAARAVSPTLAQVAAPDVPGRAQAGAADERGVPGEVEHRPGGGVDGHGAGPSPGAPSAGGSGHGGRPPADPGVSAAAPDPSGSALADHVRSLVDDAVPPELVYQDLLIRVELVTFQDGHQAERAVVAPAFGVGPVDPGRVIRAEELAAGFARQFDPAAPEYYRDGEVLYRALVDGRPDSGGYHEHLRGLIRPVLLAKDGQFADLQLTLEALTPDPDNPAWTAGPGGSLLEAIRWGDDAGGTPAASPDSPGQGPVSTVSSVVAALDPVSVEPGSTDGSPDEADSAGARHRAARELAEVELRLFQLLLAVEGPDGRRLTMWQVRRVVEAPATLDAVLAEILPDAAERSRVYAEASTLVAARTVADQRWAVARQQMAEAGEAAAGQLPHEVDLAETTLAAEVLAAAMTADLVRNGFPADLAAGLVNEVIDGQLTGGRPTVTEWSALAVRLLNQSVPDELTGALLGLVDHGVSPAAAEAVSEAVSGSHGEQLSGVLQALEGLRRDPRNPAWVEGVGELLVETTRHLAELTEDLRAPVPITEPETSVPTTEPDAPSTGERRGRPRRFSRGRAVLAAAALALAGLAARGIVVNQSRHDPASDDRPAHVEPETDPPQPGEEPTAPTSEPAPPPPPAETETFTNPVFPHDHPDPAILRVGEWWYAYSTAGWRGRVPVTRSRDLVHWEMAGDAMPQPSTWSQPDSGYWAPEVKEIGGRYVLYYTAPLAGGHDRHGIGLAVADRPEGPFVDPSTQPLVYGAIDASPFLDDDGRLYLTWKDEGTADLFIQELSPDGRSLVGAPRSLLRHAVAGVWVGPGIEGQQIVKHGDRHYLFFSGNDYFSTRYAVGYAVSDTGPMGEYRIESPGPILASSPDPSGPKGPGHGFVFEGLDGRWWMAFHAWGFPYWGQPVAHFDPATGNVTNPDVGRTLWLAEVVWDPAGRPQIVGPATTMGPQRAPQQPEPTEDDPPVAPADDATTGGTEPGRRAGRGRGPGDPAGPPDPGGAGDGSPPGDPRLLVEAFVDAVVSGQPADVTAAEAELVAWVGWAAGAGPVPAPGVLRAQLTELFEHAVRALAREAEVRGSLTEAEALAGEPELVHQRLREASRRLVAASGHAAAETAPVAAPPAAADQLARLRRLARVREALMSGFEDLATRVPQAGRATAELAYQLARWSDAALMVRWQADVSPGHPAPESGPAAEAARLVEHRFQQLAGGGVPADPPPAQPPVPDPDVTGDGAGRPPGPPAPPAPPSDPDPEPPGGKPDEPSPDPTIRLAVYGRSDADVERFLEGYVDYLEVRRVDRVSDDLAATTGIAPGELAVTFRPSGGSREVSAVIRVEPGLAEPTVDRVTENLVVIRRPDRGRSLAQADLATAIAMVLDGVRLPAPGRDEPSVYDVVTVRARIAEPSVEFAALGESDPVRRDTLRGEIAAGLAVLLAADTGDAVAVAQRVPDIVDETLGSTGQMTRGDATALVERLMFVLAQSGILVPGTTSAAFEVWLTATMTVALDRAELLGDLVSSGVALTTAEELLGSPRVDDERLHDYLRHLDQRRAAERDLSDRMADLGPYRSLVDRVAAYVEAELDARTRPALARAELERGSPPVQPERLVPQRRAELDATAVAAEVSIRRSLVDRLLGTELPAAGRHIVAEVRAGLPVAGESAAVAPPAPASPGTGPASPAAPAPATSSEEVADGLRGWAAGQPDQTVRRLVEQRINATLARQAIQQAMYVRLVGYGLTVAQATAVIGTPAEELDAVLAQLFADVEWVRGQMADLFDLRAAALSQAAEADTGLHELPGFGQPRDALSLAVELLDATASAELLTDAIVTELAAHGMPEHLAADLVRQAIDAWLAGGVPAAASFDPPARAARARAWRDAFVSSETADRLARLPDRLVSAGVDRATVDAAMAAVMSHLAGRRDRLDTPHQLEVPQELVADGLASTLEGLLFYEPAWAEGPGSALADARRDAAQLARRYTEVAPQVPGEAAPLVPGEAAPGGLVDAVVPGLVADVNAMLGQGGLSPRGGRGSVSLDGPVHGVGSRRRVALLVRAGALRLPAALTVVEGSGPLRRDGAGWTLPLPPGTSVDEARWLVAEAVAEVVDWQRSGLTAADWAASRPDGLLHPGPLPPEYWRDPGEGNVHARDVVRLKRRLLQPFEQLKRLMERGVGTSDPRWLATQQEILEAAVSLGLVLDWRTPGAQIGELVSSFAAVALADDGRVWPPAGVRASVDQLLARLEQLFGLPLAARETFTRLVFEIATELTRQRRLRQLLLDDFARTEHPEADLALARAWEFVVPGQVVDAAARVAAVLADRSGATRDDAVTRLGLLNESVTRIDQLLADVWQHGDQLGPLLVYVAQAMRYGAQTQAAAEALQQALVSAGRSDDETSALVREVQEGVAPAELSLDPAQRRVADVVSGTGASARQYAEAVPGTAAGVVSRTREARWSLVDRWVEGVLDTHEDRQLMEDAAGRPFEPLGELGTGWHTLRRIAEGLVRGTVTLLTLQGSLGLLVAAGVALPLYAIPVVQGLSDRVFKVAGKILRTHQSSPSVARSVRRRLAPSAVGSLPTVALAVAMPHLAPSASQGLARDVSLAVPEPVNQGLRGWMDTIARRVWTRHEARRMVALMREGRLPSPNLDPFMDRVDAQLAAVRELTAQIKLAVRSGRALDPSEWEQLERLHRDLTEVAGQLEETARAQAATHRRAASPADTPRRWFYQGRRFGQAAPTFAVRVLAGLSRNDPELAWQGAPDVPGTAAVGHGEYGHARDTLDPSSGLEVAVKSQVVRYVADEVGDLVGAAGRRGASRRLSDARSHLTGARRSMPDYRAQVRRARLPSPMVIAALGLIGMTGGLGWGAVAFGAGGALAFGQITKFVDWAFRQETALAELRAGEAAAKARQLHDVYRANATDPAADLSRVAGDTGRLKGEVTGWAAARTATPEAGTTGGRRRWVRRAALVAAPVALALALRGDVQRSQPPPAPEPRQPEPAEVVPQPPPEAPDDPVVVEPAPSQAPQVYEVAEGDRMWDIAGRTLGDELRYPEIAALNPELAGRHAAFPDHIEPGDQLLLPPDAKDGGVRPHATGVARPVEPAAPAPSPPPQPPPAADRHRDGRAGPPAVSEPADHGDETDSGRPPERATLAEGARQTRGRVRGESDPGAGDRGAEGDIGRLVEQVRQQIIAAPGRHETAVPFVQRQLTGDVPPLPVSALTHETRSAVAQLLREAAPVVGAALRELGVEVDDDAVIRVLEELVATMAVRADDGRSVRAELVRELASRRYRMEVSLALVDTGDGATRAVTTADLATHVVHELTHLLQGSPEGLRSLAVQDREVVAHRVEREFLYWLRERVGEEGLPADLATLAGWSPDQVEGVVRGFLHDLDGSRYLASVGRPGPDGTIREHSQRGPAEGGLEGLAGRLRERAFRWRLRDAVRAELSGRLSNEGKVRVRTSRKDYLAGDEPVPLRISVIQPTGKVLELNVYLRGDATSLSESYLGERWTRSGLLSTQFRPTSVIRAPATWPVERLASEISSRVLARAGWQPNRGGEAGRSPVHNRRIRALVLGGAVAGAAILGLRGDSPAATVRVPGDAREIQVRPDRRTGELVVETLDHGFVLDEIHRSPADVPLVIQGGPGSERITVSPDVTANVSVTGGGGNDVIRGGSGNDRLAGGPGNDALYGGAGADWVSGGPGRDYLDGYLGADVLDGGDGRDTSYGGPGSDRMSAGAGDDYLDGGTGPDQEDGGAGRDVVSGGLGDDQLRGGAGDDTFYTVGGEDIVDGQAGDDTAYHHSSDRTHRIENPTEVEGRAEWRSFIEPDDDPTVLQETLPEGTVDPGFTSRVADDLDLLASSPRGQRMIDTLRQSEDRRDRHGRVVHRYEDPSNHIRIVQWHANGGFSSEDPDGVSPGQRWLIGYDPELDFIAGAPPIVVLYHELAHAYNEAHANVEAMSSVYTGPGEPDRIATGERTAVGLPIDLDDDPDTPERTYPGHPLALTENGLREELGPGVPQRDLYLGDWAPDRGPEVSGFQFVHPGRPDDGEDQRSSPAPGQQPGAEPTGAAG